jgi:hypothetical protein
LRLSKHHHLPLEDDSEPRGHSSLPNSVIEQPFERLTKFSSQLYSAVELTTPTTTTIFDYIIIINFPCPPRPPNATSKCNSMTPNHPRYIGGASGVL